MSGSPRTTLRDCLLAIAIALGLAAAAGHASFYDEADSPAERAQRRQAAIEQCRALYGFNARILQLPEGHLVCRKGGPTT